MRVPNWDRFVHWSQNIAILICGMIIGAAVFMSITHHHLEAEITKSKALQSEIDDLLEDNEDLNMYKNKQTVIKSVRVGVNNPPDEKDLDEVIKSEIVQRVENDLKKLKGQPISNIEENPNQLRDVYGARLLPGIHGKDYIVEIHALLVIYGELKIWISTKEYIRQPS